jgi:hypothetical protein
MTRVCLTCFPCEVIGLMTMSSSEVRVVSGSGRILCVEMPFRLAVVIRGLLVVVRRIVMVARGRMLTGHGRASDLQLAGYSCR